MNNICSAPSDSGFEVERCLRTFKVWRFAFDGFDFNCLAFIIRQFVFLKYVLRVNCGVKNANKKGE